MGFWDEAVNQVTARAVNDAMLSSLVCSIEEGSADNMRRYLQAIKDAKSIYSTHRYNEQREFVAQIEKLVEEVYQARKAAAHTAPTGKETE